MEDREIVIEGEGEILGRVAALAAKKALQGNKVIVLNCKRLLISGNKKDILDNYLSLRHRRNVKFPSQPEQIMKRTIRGMIKYKSGRGEVALKRVMCYTDSPPEYHGKESLKLGNKNKKYMNLEELGKSLKQGR